MLSGLRWAEFKEMMIAVAMLGNEDLSTVEATNCANAVLKEHGWEEIP